jgi:hypothetical protein
MGLRIDHNPEDSSLNIRGCETQNLSLFYLFQQKTLPGIELCPYSSHILTIFS